METRDASLVWDIAQHPDVRSGVWGDNWPMFSKEKWRALMYELVSNVSNHVLVVWNGAKAVGCWVLESKGEGCMEVHTMMSPDCRGRDAIQAGKMAIRYTMGMNDISKLVSLCPACLPHTLLYAKFCGFTKTGVSDKTWKQNGVEHPMFTVELLTKP